MNFIRENRSRHQKKPEKVCHKVACTLPEEACEFFGNPHKFVVHLSAHTFQEEEEADKEGNDVVEHTKEEKPACRLISIYREVQESANHHEIKASETSGNHGNDTDGDGNEEERKGIAEGNGVPEGVPDIEKETGHKAPVEHGGDDQGKNLLFTQVPEVVQALSGREKE